eukprot:4373025-Pleurochrysis_carterae.AAC.1
MVIKSDSSTVFRNKLTGKFAEYAGLHCAFVLPCNAPAKGMAEQSFQNWSDTLPIVAFALNCTKQLSTGVLPFFALYGQHNISLAFKNLHPAWGSCGSDIHQVVQVTACKWAPEFFGSDVARCSVNVHGVNAMASSTKALRWSLVVDHVVAEHVTLQLVEGPESELKQTSIAVLL